MNKRATLALLYGGRGYESEVSIDGAKFLLSKIDREEINPLPVFISKSGEWLIDSRICECDPLLLSRGEIPAISVAPAYRDGKCGLFYEGGFLLIDCAFVLLHGNFGEDGVVEGALENARIPYVGESVRVGSLLCDKAYTKIIAEHLGIPVAKWVLGTPSVHYSKQRARELAEKAFSYPLFIKPTSLGSSVGASVVREEEGFDLSYDTAASLGDGRVLIEEYANIEVELECAYFAVEGKEIFTNIGEISYASDFYDYDTKYSCDSSAIAEIHSTVSEEIRAQVLDYSKRLVSYFGIRDLSRIDFFLTRDGRLLFNEINTMPGFTASSLYPRLLMSEGISVGDLVTLLAKKAIKRGA